MESTNGCRQNTYKTFCNRENLRIETICSHIAYCLYYHDFIPENSCLQKINFSNNYWLLQELALNPFKQTLIGSIF